MSKFALDTEFIDTPTCSALISLALVRSDGAFLYFEFDYPKSEVTDWLEKNVIPFLDGKPVSQDQAAAEIRSFVGDGLPEFWCYYGAYDWYFFCRLFGGFIQMPPHWPHRYRELADYQDGIPDIAGAAHNALNDCRSMLAVMKQKRLA